jgi:phenylalanyl-tRNA synthetase beta chain
MPAQVSRCLSNEPALLGDDGAFPIKIGACCAVSKVRVRCVRVCDKLSEDHGGLLELAAEAPGQNIREHSQFDRCLVHTQANPNLAHCLSKFMACSCPVLAKCASEAPEFSPAVDVTEISRYR